MNNFGQGRYITRDALVKILREWGYNPDDILVEEVNLLGYTSVVRLPDGSKAYKDNELVRIPKTWNHPDHGVVVCAIMDISNRIDNMQY